MLFQTFHHVCETILINSNFTLVIIMEHKQRNWEEEGGGVGVSGIASIIVHSYRHPIIRYRIHKLTLQTRPGSQLILRN